jgi:hypothetical protein
LLILSMELYSCRLISSLSGREFLMSISRDGSQLLLRGREELQQQACACFGINAMYGPVARMSSIVLDRTRTMVYVYAHVPVPHLYRRMLLYSRLSLSAHASPRLDSRIDFQLPHKTTRVPASGGDRTPMRLSSCDALAACHAKEEARETA